MESICNTANALIPHSISEKFKDATPPFVIEDSPFTRENYSEISALLLSRDTVLMEWRVEDSNGHEEVISEGCAHLVQVAKILTSVIGNSSALKTINSEESNQETTGIPEICEQNFKISPNPTNGKFTIEAVNINNIKIYDLVGKLVEEFNPQTSHFTTEVDLSDKARGIYVVKVSGENYSEVKKLIFQ